MRVQQPVGRIFLALCVASLLGVGSPAPPLAAQQADVIRGRVTSDDGQGVANANVQATSIPNNVNRSTRSDRAGRFTLTFPGGDDEQSIALLQAIVVCIAAALYGIGRPAYYHPRRREAYRLWLEQTFG